MVELGDADSKSVILWTLSKSELKQIVLSEITEDLVMKWEKARPGEQLAERFLMDGVRLVISRTKHSEGLMLNLFVHDGDADSAQVELRRESETEWNLADRQVDATYQGKGILRALVAASEKFVELFAEKESSAQREVREHRIVIHTGQPNVYQVFFHLGYVATEECRGNANILANPGSYPTVSVRHAWVRNMCNAGMTEMTNRDSYCFQNSLLAQSPQPTAEDAVRVTLEKRLKSKKGTISRENNEVRDAIGQVL